MTHTESEYKGWTSQVHLHLAQRLSQCILARPPSLRTWTLYWCWSLGHIYGLLLHLCCHTHLCLHATASACPNHCSFMTLRETTTCVLRSCFASNCLALLAPFLVHIFLESYFILAAKTSAENFSRQGLIMQPRLFSNSWSSWLICPSTGITGMYRIPYTEIFITHTVNE